MSDRLVIGFVFVAALPIVIAYSLLRPYTIPGASMKPNLLAGDYMLAERFRTDWHRALMRGDVVTFNHRKTVYVKRIVGLPGDKIQLRKSVLHISDVAVTTKAANGDPKFIVETLPNGKSFRVINGREDDIPNNTPEFEVPENHYFMLGDNRNNSDDSRFSIGFVHKQDIIGRVRFVLWNTKGAKSDDRVY